MSHAETIAAAVLTVLTLVTVAARQVVGLRGPTAPARWLTALAAVLVLALLVAMALRLRTAL